MAAELCDCENLGWPGSDSCPVHPECTKKTGCLDYPDPYQGPHDYDVDRMSEKYRRLYLKHKPKQAK